MSNPKVITRSQFTKLISEMVKQEIVKHKEENPVVKEQNNTLGYGAVNQARTIYSRIVGDMNHLVGILDKISDEDEKYVMPYNRIKEINDSLPGDFELFLKPKRK